MKRFFLFSFLGLAACTSAVESSDPTPAPAPAVAAPAAPVAHGDADRVRTTDDDAFDLGTGRTQPSAFVCRKGAFCEDFEEVGFGAHWADAVATAGGKIELGQDSASPGKGALRLSAHDSGAAAFLFTPKGDVAGDWSGSLGFAFRVDQIPGVYLGGPELTVKSADGPITIRIGLRPEGLVLEQLADATCLRDRCAPSSKIIAPSQPNHWYRVQLGFEVNTRQAGPYGRIEVSVDGGELQGADLTVPFFDGSVFLRAGITQGDARRAFADLDDVSLLVR